MLHRLTALFANRFLLQNRLYLRTFTAYRCAVSFSLVEPD